jgi:DNA-binding MarR family transcriptional regulator
MGDTFATPRDTDSLAVIIAKVGQLDRRAGAREIVRRVALRAGVQLDPASCWLLARLSEEARANMEGLAERAGVAVDSLIGVRDGLLQRELIAPCPGHTGACELTAAGRSILERLTRTGERRLADLLADWRPEENPDLAKLIVDLAQAFFIDTSALRERSRGSTMG